ncbi:two-component regulator propeller domain-containing protein [Balneolales bacterium ANBcel1]|nr:two-component regulator propeller domain-containing protein [Balneolales bacterium ANBcel1]
MCSKGLRAKLVLAAAVFGAFFLGIGASCFAAYQDAFKDDLRFHHLTTSEGLSHPSVRAIYQDRSGFMWFGTNIGLTRYDGFEMTIYRNDAEDPYTIASNAVSVLLEDSRGYFWVGTQGGGLHLYDEARDRFLRIPDKSDDTHSLHNSTILSLNECSDGFIWIGTYDGIYMVKPDQSIEKLEFPSGAALSNPAVSSFEEDGQGRIWVGTQGGLNIIDRDREDITPHHHDPNWSGRISSDHIRTLYRDHHGTMWIGTQGGGLVFFDQERETFVPVAEDPRHPAFSGDEDIHTISEDNEGKLWIGTAQKGLIRMDSLRTRSVAFQYHPDDPYSVNEGVIYDVYESRDQILWVATQAGGVSYLDQGLYYFEHFSRGLGGRQNLSNNLVWSFAQDDAGDIWIATAGGLNRFDPVTGTFETLTHDPDNLQSIPADVLIHLHVNEEGLWMGTLANGVSLMDTESRTFRHFRHDPDDPYSLSHNDVFRVYEDSRGAMWFATNGGGANRLDPDRTRFTRYLADPADSNSIGNNDVRSFHECSRGEFWIGTYSGDLTRFDRETGLFHHYEINEGRRYRSSVIQDFREDRTGRLWLATRGGGLLLFDREERAVSRSYTIDDGLPGNMVHAILEDDQGLLWLSTNSGLARFNPERETFQHFDETAGVQRSDFYKASKLKDRNGYMYFGGYNGFNRFDPLKVELRDDHHPVIFADLQLFNRSLPIGGDSPLQEQINLLDTLVVSHDASMLTFRFSALNFSAVKGNHFAYILEGFDSDWNYIGSQRSATYTNLNPGTYRLRVMATNNDGIWPEEARELVLIVTPPFWRTAWFMAASLLFLVLALFTGYQLRVRAINIRNRKLRYQVAERTRKLRESNRTKDRILSIIAHDINNVAFGIVGFVELLNESVQNNNEEEIREYSGRLSHSTFQFQIMIRNLLNWSRSQSGRIDHHPETIGLSGIIEAHISNEASRAIGKSIQLYSTVSPEREVMVYADRNLLSVVLRNLINNAIKFTHENGRVEISAEEKEDCVEIVVSDNGVGMSPDQIDQVLNASIPTSTRGTNSEKGTGLGLAVVRDFIRINGGKLRIESQPGKGSRFFFTVPKPEKQAVSH